MSVSSPTHVVTISVWDTHRGQSVVNQAWVNAGPFDGPDELADHLAVSLVEACDAVEVVQRVTSSARPPQFAWEQLTLL
jgi:hypothetical protein